jgi:UDP-glucose 4-epimerase
MKSKVSVIGGAGFIGSHLVSLLLKNNYRVIVIDDFSTGSPDNLKNDLANPDLFCFNFDILTDSRVKLATLIGGSSHVFHLAAKTSVEESQQNPQSYLKVNFLGTVAVAEAMKRAKIKHIIFSSTSAVYGETSIFPTHEGCAPNPISPYATSKLMAENFLKDQDYISSVSLRYFNVYGDRPNLRGSYRPVMSVFLEKFMKGEPLPIVNGGSQSRDFINVEDVALANLAAMKVQEGHEVFNVGSGQDLSVKWIADSISHNQIEASPRIEPSRSLADISKIKRRLGWEPAVNFSEWISPRIMQQMI